MLDNDLEAIATGMLDFLSKELATISTDILCIRIGKYQILISYHNTFYAIYCELNNITINLLNFEMFAFEYDNPNAFMNIVQFLKERILHN